MDDVLREAIDRGDFDDLPGKGRSIDLEDYFASNPEDRIAYKLLKDNQVLPQPLQDRKEAEALRQAAQDLLGREAQALQDAREEIRRASVPLTAWFPDRQTLMDHLGLEAWPSWFAEPGEGSRHDLRQVLRCVERLRELIARYNGRVETFVVRYLDLLEQANACVRRLNDRLAFTGGFTAGFQMMALFDVLARKREVQAQFPALPPLPEDYPAHIRAFFRETRRPFWRRLRSLNIFS